MLDAVVVGAGQSGLAVSYYLRKYGASFVVLDASDEPGGAWPHYWDALTLFTVLPRGVFQPARLAHAPLRRLPAT